MTINQLKILFTNLNYLKKTSDKNSSYFIKFLEKCELSLWEFQSTAAELTNVVKVDFFFKPEENFLKHIILTFRKLLDKFVRQAVIL